MTISNQDLYFLLLRAHDEAAVANPNGSITVACITYEASGSMINALAAAALTQGHLHAPIEPARELLRQGDNAADDARSMIEYGTRVPGFGNSFYRQEVVDSVGEGPPVVVGGSDPAFAPVEAAIREHYPEVAAIIDNIRECNPKLPPANAAMWTAAVLEIMGLPIGIGPAIFIATRVRAWAEALLRRDMNETGMREAEEVEEGGTESAAPVVCVAPGEGGDGGLSLA